MDRQHHATSQGHRQDGQGGAEKVAAKRSQDEGAKELHGPPMDWMRPSRKLTRTSAMAAASALWVAIRTVAPKRLALSRSSERTWSPLAVSRLPVGSSAISRSRACTR